jgi:hypothetical protein
LRCHPTPTSANHNTTPTGILLGRTWPGDALHSVTVVFIDNIGRQLLCVDNIFIALNHGYNQQRLFPDEFDYGHFIFGTMLGLMTSPPTHSTSTIWRRLPASLAPDDDHHIHDFVAPSQVRIHLNFGVAVPRLLLATSRDDARTETNTSNYLYFIFGYNGNPQPSC